MVVITKQDDKNNLGSHGTQPKWKVGEYWYKIDDGNYEGLAESIASDMLQKSNIVESFPTATYDPEKIKYDRKEYQGCKSPNFREPGTKLIELSELFKKYDLQKDLQTKRSAILKPEESLQTCAATVKQITGLKDFDRYLSMLLEFDAVILNEDRHYSNICIMKKADGFTYAPVFDQGRSFALSADAWYKQVPSMGLAKQIADNAEPRLYGSFAKQVAAAESLCDGKAILQIRYGTADLRKSLDRCAAVYDDKILKRAELIATLQMQKYEKYFLNDIREKRIKSLAAQINTKVSQPHTTQILQDGNIRVCLPNSAEVDKYFLISTDAGKPEISAYDNGGAALTIYDLLGSDAEALKSYTEIFAFINAEREENNISQSWEEER